MNKDTKQIIIILLVLIAIYGIYKWIERIDVERRKLVANSWVNVGSLTGRESQARTQPLRSALSGQCIKPDFKDLDLNGRECAGSVINENKILRLGDQSCEVLLLQQRLNAMQPDSYILKPNGQFDCHTKYKLNLLMGVPQITLNSFSPDEQIGFNELQGGTQITPYSYMDVNTKIR